VSTRKQIAFISLDTARHIIDRTLEGSRTSDVRPEDTLVKNLFDEMIANYGSRIFIHSMAYFTVWEKKFQAISNATFSLKKKMLALEDDSPLFYFYRQSVIYSEPPLEQLEAAEYIETLLDHLSRLERYTAIAIDSLYIEKKSGNKKWYEMSVSPEVWLTQEEIPELYKKIFKRQYSANDDLTSPSQRFAKVVLEVMQARRSPSTIRNNRKLGQRKKSLRTQNSA
jgi:hypothetical protein